MTTVNLSDFQKEVLLGLLLSDGYLERSSPTSGTRLGFQFTEKTPGLFAYCYNCFANLITETPSLVDKSFRDGPKFKQRFVRTRYLPILTPYYELFYIKVNGVKSKVYPPVSFLVNNLTAVGLAVLLMCDGSRKGKKNWGYEIHTQGHNFESSARLCLALYEKFGIMSWPTRDRHKDKTTGGYIYYWNIYISARSFLTWSSLVADIFRECDMYDAKMPDPPSNKSKASEKSFELFYALFKDNTELCENIYYKLPQDVIDKWH